MATAFVDKARISVRAGDGGNGVVAFHREKYVAAGGPAHAADEPGGLERPHDFVQELDGDADAHGEGGGAQGPSVAVVGQFEQDAGGVAGACRWFHACPVGGFVARFGSARRPPADQGNVVQATNPMKLIWIESITIRQVGNRGKGLPLSRGL